MQRNNNNDDDNTTFTYVYKSVIHFEHQMKIHEMVKSGTKKAPLRHGKQSQKYIVTVFYFR